MFKHTCDHHLFQLGVVGHDDILAYQIGSHLKRYILCLHTHVRKLQDGFFCRDI